MGQSRCHPSAVLGPAAPRPPPSPPPGPHGDATAPRLWAPHRGVSGVAASPSGTTRTLGGSQNKPPSLSEPRFLPAASVIPWRPDKAGRTLTSF